MAEPQTPKTPPPPQPDAGALREKLLRIRGGEGDARGQALERAVAQV